MLNRVQSLDLNMGHLSNLVRALLKGVATRQDKWNARHKKKRLTPPSTLHAFCLVKLQLLGPKGPLETRHGLF